MKVGDCLLHYQLVKMLAEGGQGQVWLAYNQSTDEKVAIKLPSESTAISSLAEEHKVLLKLRKAGGHPNIVGVVDYFPTHHPSFLVLEYRKGLNLAEYVKKHGIFNAEDFKKPLQCILDALEFSHLNGVFHRDITPSNILFDGITKEAHLLDFGLSKVFNDNVSRLRLSFSKVEENIVGKSEWISPEVREGKGYTARSDLYGVGLVTVYALTGARPATREFWNLESNKHQFSDLFKFIIATTDTDINKRPTSVASAKEKYFSFFTKLNNNESTTLFEQTEENQENEKNYKIFEEVLNGNVSNLRELTSITDEITQELATYKLLSLNLPKLSSITPNVAKELSKLECWLHLDGLTSISVEVANGFVNYQGKGIYLNGLISITSEIAREFCRYKCDGLFLDGLTTITPNIAQELSKFKGVSLSLNGLTSMTTDIAIELSKYKGDIIELDGLISITPEISQELAKLECSLLLNGLTSLSPLVAQKLSGYRGENLELYGISSVTFEVAKILANNENIILSQNTQSIVDIANDTLKSFDIFNSNEIRVRDYEWVKTCFGCIISGIVVFLISMLISYIVMQFN